MTKPSDRQDIGGTSSSREWTVSIYLRLRVSPFFRPCVHKSCVKTAAWRGAMSFDIDFFYRNITGYCRNFHWVGGWKLWGQILWNSEMVRLTFWTLKPRSREAILRAKLSDKVVGRWVEYCWYCSTWFPLMKGCQPVFSVYRDIAGNIADTAVIERKIVDICPPIGHVTATKLEPVARSISLLRILR